MFYNSCFLDTQGWVTEALPEDSPSSAMLRLIERTKHWDSNFLVILLIDSSTLGASQVTHSECQYWVTGAGHFKV